MRILIYLLIFVVILTGCQLNTNEPTLVPSEVPTTVSTDTVTPEPTLIPSPTPFTQTTPHDGPFFTPVNALPGLTGFVVSDFAWPQGNRNFAYPNTHFPVCDPFYGLPCAFSFNESTPGVFRIESHDVAGLWGFGVDTVLYADSDYNYAIRVLTSPRLRDAESYDNFSVDAYIIDSNGIQYELVQQGFEHENTVQEFLFAFEVSRADSYTIYTGVKGTWPLSDSQFNITYVGIWTIPPDWSTQLIIP